MSTFARSCAPLRARPSLVGVSAIVAVAALVSGFLAGVPDAVPIAFAACGSGFSQTCYVDATLTSALDVLHTYPDGGVDIPVQPDTGETWTVTAYWKTLESLGIPAACRCNSASAAVTVDVDWTGSAWSASCTGCNALAGPIFGVSVCSQGERNCSVGEDTHSFGYRLIVDVARASTAYACPPSGPFARYLDNVTYEATGIDDGDILDMTRCAIGADVSPDPDGTFADTDAGEFECAFDCTATGASVAIEYE